MFPLPGLNPPSCWPSGPLDVGGGLSGVHAVRRVEWGAWPGYLEPRGFADLRLRGFVDPIRGFAD